MTTKTTTTLALGLLACLALGAGPVAADGPATPALPQQSCEPIWIDSNNQIHYDPDCIGPLFANRP